MLVNGKQTSLVSAHDRGLAYGDGVFETIRIAGGEILFLDEHLARLRQGCERLGITPPPGEELDADLHEMLKSAPGDAVIKIVVTRGEGHRGYRPSSSPTTRIVSWSAFEKPSGTEAGVDVWRCETRLAINPPLAGIKHLNRLEQVLAAAEIPQDCFEGLVCDMDGHPVEGTRSNLFIVRDGRLRTPTLDRCGVEGVLRKLIIRKQDVEESRLVLDDVLGAEEVFVCNSVFGVVPVRRIVGRSGTHDFEIGAVGRAMREAFDL